MQRMTARLLAAFLFTEKPTLTASDLVEQLGVSTGSVSMAIRTLTSVGLVEQAPAPGSRRDHFRMRTDAWATLFSSHNDAVRVMLDAAGAGIAASAPGSLARQRLEDMRDFHAFILAEIPALVEHWHQQRNHLTTGRNNPRRTRSPRNAGDR
jgi:DNA-binding transcriptional regulator GbsR (MarR family)